MCRREGSTLVAAANVSGRVLAPVRASSGLSGAYSGDFSILTHTLAFGTVPNLRALINCGMHAGREWSEGFFSFSGRAFVCRLKRLGCGVGCTARTTSRGPSAPVRDGQSCDGENFSPCRDSNSGLLHEV